MVYKICSQYRAAEQDDLWRHLTQQAHRDGTLPKDVTVKEVMDTWTLQMGFPVVNVERDYAGKTANVSQSRYLNTPPKSGSSDGHDYMWWVPVTFATPGTSNFDNTYSDVWIRPTDRDGVMVDGLPDASTPVVFNVQETGYYRVNYDRKNWELLIAQLNSDHRKIHVINRAQIIDDAFNLARAGRLDYELALGVTGYMDKETEYIAWNSALSGFSYIDNMLKRTPAYGEFKVMAVRNICSTLNR